MPKPINLDIIPFHSPGLRGNWAKTLELDYSKVWVQVVQKGIAPGLAKVGYFSCHGADPHCCSLSSRVLSRSLSVVASLDFPAC